MPRTSAGRTWQATLMGDRATRPAAADLLALSQDGTAVADGDTALTGEITTSGLARTQAVYAYTAGANSYTLTKTFTAVAADVSGGTVTVRKVGVFNAASAGTMPFAETFADAPLAVAGDSVTVTVTVSMV